MCFCLLFVNVIFYWFLRVWYMITCILLLCIWPYVFWSYPPWQFLSDPPHTYTILVSIFSFKFLGSDVFTIWVLYFYNFNHSSPSTVTGAPQLPHKSMAFSSCFWEFLLLQWTVSKINLLHILRKLIMPHFIPVYMNFISLQCGDFIILIHKFLS